MRLVFNISFFVILSISNCFAQAESYESFIDDLIEDYPSYSFLYGNINLNIVDFLINDNYLLLTDHPNPKNVAFYLFNRQNMLLSDSLMIRNVTAPHIASRFISNHKINKEAFYFRPLSYLYNNRQFFRNITIRARITEEGHLQHAAFPDNEPIKNDIYLHFLQTKNNGLNIHGEKLHLIINEEIISEYKIRKDKKKNVFLVHDSHEVKFFASGNGNDYPNTHLFPFTINSDELILIDVIGQKLIQANSEEIRTKKVNLHQSFFNASRIELLLDEAYGELYARLIFSETNSEELYKLIGSNFERHNINLGTVKHLSSSGSLSFKTMKIHSGKLYTVFTLKEDNKKEFDALMFTVL
uniref:hypothetical protein n=3 Tax=Roseivirga sp. TaxID=1964215 RepID=UPI004047F99F